MADLAVGANLPWIEYGQDFGASSWRPQGGVAQPDRRERMRRELARLAESGATVVRWWLLGDGRAGLREDALGRVAGPDDRLFPDVDAAVLGLREAGLQALFVLVDFLWLDTPRLVNGVRLGGRRDQVRDPSLRARLVDTLFVPLAERYGREPAIAGWDLMNEPEWATLGPFHAESAVAGLAAAYARDESDEFVQPTAIHAAGDLPVRMRDGDGVILMNFRADRAPQITRAMIDDAFDGFTRRSRVALSDFVMLTRYADDIDTSCAFETEAPANTFGEYISRLGLTQLRIAETEKYAHVTFFFSGGREEPFPGEERILVPSPKVATYDLKPEMSAIEVTDKLVEAIQSRRFRLLDVLADTKILRQVMSYQP